MGRGVGQLHDQGQLALAGNRAVADVGLPVEMPRPVGPVAHDLRAFGEIRHVEAEGIAVGIGHQPHQARHHPVGARNLIQPGHVGVPNATISGLADQACVLHRAGCRKRDDAVAFVLREGVGNGERGLHLGPLWLGPAW